MCPTCRANFPNDVAFCGNDGAITIEERPDGVRDSRLGQNVGGYVLVAHVADGAMARVYEGRHPETRERVAVKILHPQVAQDSVAVERFKREHETAAELAHRHVVKVLGFGATSDGSHFMTMEFLEGQELSHRLRNHGALSTDVTARILSQIALGLEHAHSFGVVHRDLKPDNVFLCHTDVGDDVRILDFGSVKLQMEMGPKLTAYGTTLGSPYYMSPEQAMGRQDVDQRTDVFALGTILYEMLTGKVCFDGDSVAEILMKILNGPAPKASATVASVPAAVDAVIERALEKEKEKRFGSIAELAAAFGGALGLSGGPAEWSVRRTERPPPPSRPLSVSVPAVAAALSERTAEARAPASWSAPSPAYGSASGAGARPTAASIPVPLVRPTGGSLTRTSVIPGLRPMVGLAAVVALLAAVAAVALVAVLLLR